MYPVDGPHAYASFFIGGLLLELFLPFLGNTTQPGLPFQPELFAFYARHRAQLHGLPIEHTVGAYGVGSRDQALVPWVGSKIEARHPCTEEMLDHVCRGLLGEHASSNAFQRLEGEDSIEGA